MLAVMANFTMWDNMIKDRIWFVFMKHLGSSKRRYRAEWSAQDVLRHWYCHLRWYQSFSTGDCFRTFTIRRLPVLFGLKLFLCTHFEMPLTPLRSQSEKTTWNCGMAHVFWWQPRACTTKKNTVINQYELQLQAGSKLSGGSLPLIRVIASLLQRVDPAKIAVMDCGFKLIRIFQQELWWIFKLNTDVWAGQRSVALNYTPCITPNPPDAHEYWSMHVWSKGWHDAGDNLSQVITPTSKPRFPSLFDSSGPFGSCHIQSSDLLTPCLQGEGLEVFCLWELAGATYRLGWEYTRSTWHANGVSGERNSNDGDKSNF